ncbi:MAG: FeoA domain-containing protein [Planctomycetota bacterium]|nr:FeoA domain-containing protein [Planctomycetota bacterium]
MNEHDHVCICHRVSLAKLRAFLVRENPSVASLMTECLGAGTGCGWCRSQLESLHAQHKAGQLPIIEGEHDAYRERRILDNRIKKSVGLDIENESQYDAKMSVEMSKKRVRIPLSQLPVGARARVDCSALTHLPESDRCLLAAMGLADQCEVERCSGHECIIRIDRTRIALARPLADQVLVEPLNPS